MDFTVPVYATGMPKPRRCDDEFKSNADLAAGVSGRAALDTEAYNFKADRRISSSDPKGSK